MLVALLEYRATPVQGTGLAPCQVLMSRLLRSKIPISRSVLKPEVQLGVKDKILESQVQSKNYHDKNSKVKRDFKGPDVVYRKDGVWKPAQIVGTAAGPRSYLIRGENGRVLTRNTVHLRQSFNAPRCNYNDVSFDFDEENVSIPNQPNVINQNVNQPNPNQPEINDQNVEMPNDQNYVYHTRSGRPVRRPIRFQ